MKIAGREVTDEEVSGYQRDIERVGGDEAARACMARLMAKDPTITADELRAAAALLILVVGRVPTRRQ